MKRSFKYLFLFLGYFCFSQEMEEPLFLMDEITSITSNEFGKLNYTLVIKSKNESFNTDAYKFEIPNRKNFEEFYTLKEVRKAVILDTIQFLRKNELKSYDPCDLHQYISSKQNIFLLIKDNKKYYYFELDYLGTQKNIEILKNGF